MIDPELEIKVSLWLQWREDGLELNEQEIIHELRANKYAMLDIGFAPSFRSQYF